MSSSKCFVRYSLDDEILPLQSTKCVNLKEIVEELLWSIKGNTNAKVLSSKGVNIWDVYGSRSYLDSLGFTDRAEGDLGPVHGWQWRYFGAKYVNKDNDYSGQGVDQLSQVIERIKTNPNDRRLIVCSWNVSDISKMAIPPHHCLFQFYVANGKLSCLLYQSSMDKSIGVSLNIASYSLLTHMVAHVTNLQPGEFIHIIGDAHMHLNNSDPVTIQPMEKSNSFPKLRIKRKVDSIDDFKADDFELIYHEAPIKTSVKPERLNSVLPPFQTCLTINEKGYLDMIKFILENGTKKGDRTGVGTISCFGLVNRYSLADEILPLLTTKRVYWKGILEELLWFIQGNTNAKSLSDKGVHIWDANGSRAFLDALGFTDREEGDLGPVYGHQWRHFGSKYKTKDTDYSGQGVDQLSQVIEKIKTHPNDGSLIVCSWNVSDIPIMALPPCHCLFQFFVTDGKLSCILYQRSGDMGLGVPFNIASYSLLTYMVAQVTNLQPGDFFHYIGDAHIYLNHIEALKIQLTREPRPFPKLHIKRKVESIENFKSEDFEIIGYKPHPKIEMAMAV